MIKIFKKIHYSYFIFVIVTSFLLFLPFYYAFTRKTKFYRILNILRKVHSFVCTSLVGIFFQIEYEEKINKHQNYIYCANHFSDIDTLLLCILAKGNFHFMGKQELINNPIMAMFFNTIDIPVYRESKISAFRAFKKASTNLQNGMSLIIFPEGKIGDDYPPKLNEFKNGPFRLAIEQNIPIVPITITNLWELMWDNGQMKGTKSGICKVYVHRPVFTSALSFDNTDDLKALVFDKINSKLKNENR